MRIAKTPTANKVLTVKAYYAKRDGKPMPDKPYQWSAKSIAGILGRPEYTRRALNFKTYSKSYKLKKRLNNTPENYRIFPEIQPAIIQVKAWDGCRNYGQTNVAPPSKLNGKGCSPDYCTALTVGANCTLQRVRT